MSDALYVPRCAVRAETEVKKSRFVARAALVTDRASAMAMVEQARRDYPDARHHCWAYLIGNPNSASSAAMKGKVAKALKKPTGALTMWPSL